MKRYHRLLLALAALFLLLGGGWFLYRTGFFAAARSVQGLRDYISRSAPYAHLCFLLVQLLSVVLAPIPSNIVAAAGGLLFGAWPAFLLTFGAVTTGSLLTFSLARVLGRNFASLLVSRSLSEKYQELIRAKTTVFLTLAFLFPFFPDDLLCIMAGLTEIPFRRFLFLVLLGRPWGLLVSAAVGSSVMTIPWWGMALLGVGGAALFLGILRYGDRIEEAIMNRLKDPKAEEIS